MYLEGDSDFDAPETCVITFAPDAMGERRELLDQIADEMFYVWDGIADEATFRRRMGSLAGMWSAQSEDAGARKPFNVISFKYGRRPEITPKNPYEGEMVRKFKQRPCQTAIWPGRRIISATTYWLTRRSVRPL